MSSTIIAIVEGKTEQRFFDRVISPYLKSKADIEAWAQTITTGKNRRKGGLAKGGFGRFSKVESTIGKVLRTNRGNTFRFTTMLDFCDVKSDFPGYATRPSADAYSVAAHLEQSFGDKIDDYRLIPYLQLHEFEAALFTDVQSMQYEFIEISKQSLSALESVRHQFDGNPELINSVKQPSEHINDYVSGFERQKATAGVEVAELIGIDRIMENCRHFREWIEKLQNAFQ